MTMTNETQNDLQDGLYLRGTFLGVQESREFTPRGTTEKRTVRPRLGLLVDGEEMELACRDDAHMAEVRKGLVKGDVVLIRVEASPPFGASGSVRFNLPGAIERRSNDWK